MAINLIRKCIEIVKSMVKKDKYYDSFKPIILRLELPPWMVYALVLVISVIPKPGHMCPSVTWTEICSGHSCNTNF